MGIVGLVRRLTGLNLGLPVTLLVVAAVPLGLLYASLRLDEVGDIRTATVTERAEQVSIGAGGDWQIERRLTLGYSTPESQNPRSTQQTTTLHDTDPVAFAHTAVGSSLDLRVLRLADQISLVRPASVSTASLVPWDLVQPAALLVGAIVVVWRLRRTSLGKALIAAVVLAGLSYPLVHAAQIAGERSDLSGATQHATATITDVTRITRIDIGGRRRTDYHNVPQPYDIVQLELREPGAGERVLAVDAVDADDSQPLARGATVSVVYPPEAPHAAQLEGRARTYAWRTTLGVYQDYALLGAGVVGLLLAVALLGRMFRVRRHTSATEQI
jgi:hypothetical protein